MTNKFSEKSNTSLTLPKMSSTALKGKQSVRTSFKLSEGCIQAISIVATQLGIKHRSLFDYLVEDTDSLEALAKEIVDKEPAKNKGSQKSFIVSRETLRVIDSLCEKLKISRDTLIELSVRRLLPIIEKEMQGHSKRKELFELVNKHYQESRNVLDSIKKSVGKEDPAYRAYQTTVAACKQVKNQFNDIISKGKVIEKFDPGSLKE
jgi:hypothetical protein